MTSTLDFGYPWWLSSGHLLLFVIGLVLTVAARVWKWRRGVTIALIVFTLWAAAAAAVVWRFGINRVPPLPTQSFLTGGAGRVLDLGVGTGRSTIMVLASRPHATVVASDLFAESFDQHFGPGLRPQERLRANLEAAGVASRASIETADMRQLPFDTGSFDAAVSAYAMDHLNRDGSKQALKEAHRVLRPGGDLLLILVENDVWAKLLFGPLLSHGGTRGAAWWRQAAEEAGFIVAEQGTTPVTLFFLFRR
jgi:SAM-dependent methyltransferase